MRTVRLIAVLLFLLPIVQLATAQQMDQESQREIRNFRLNDDVMQRYNGLVQASTAARARRANPETWPVRALPSVMPSHLGSAAALLEASEPMGPMLREHHLTGKEYLCILMIRMGARDSLQRPREISELRGEPAPLLRLKPWVSAENLSYLQTCCDRQRAERGAVLR